MLNAVVRFHDQWIGHRNQRVVRATPSLFLCGRQPAARRAIFFRVLRARERLIRFPCLFPVGKRKSIGGLLARNAAVICGPDQFLRDMAHEVGRAIVSAIPAAGGPLQVAFENVFASPIEKRKQAWLEQLADIVTEVQDRVKELTPEKLTENEAFVTVAMQASQIAIRNHQQTKLEALRNAVLNSGLPNPLQEDEQMVFLRLIDQLTPWHLRVLSLLNNPIEWMKRNQVAYPGWGMGGISTVIEHCLPDLRVQRDTYDQIVRDLQVEGLVGQGQFLHLTMTGSGMVESRTTDRGKRFIKFTTAPT